MLAWRDSRTVRLRQSSKVALFTQESRSPLPYGDAGVGRTTPRDAAARGAPKAGAHILAFELPAPARPWPTPPRLRQAFAPAPVSRPRAIQLRHAQRTVPP